MRIAYLSNSILPSRTANSVHVMKMCRAFAKLGHEVVLFAPDRREDREECGGDIHGFYGIEKCFRIELHPWPKYRFRSQVYSAMAARALSRLAPDLIYSRTLFGSAWTGLFGMPSVLESHSPVSGDSRIQGRLLKALYRSGRISKMVVISRALQRHYAEIEGYPSRDLLVAPDAADEPVPGPPPPWIGSGGRLQVGYVGNLFPGKGMEIVEAIAPAMPEADFHVVGGFEKDISAWRGRLKAPNVRFHGFLRQAELGGVLRALDICLLPNQKVVKTHSTRKLDDVNIAAYTSPLKMFDYMAHGKAIVSSDLPVLREILHEGNSVLVDPEDPGAWVRAIRGLADPERRRALGGAARAEFLRGHTWERRAAGILAALSGKASAAAIHSEPVMEEAGS